MAEEHELRSRHEASSSLTDDERARLTRLEQHLDQLWDLLRQRRARREAGQDVSDTAERPPGVVENYRN